MDGLLTQAETLSSGSGPNTPPAESPGAGLPPLGGSEPGSEQPAEAGPMPSPDEMVAEAVTRIWGENFDKMVDMFEKNGPEDFARSMGVAVNTGIDYLESQHGPIGHEAAAKVGMEILMRLVDDIVVKGLMPDVQIEQIHDAIPAAMVMYADARPDVSKEDIQMVMQQVMDQAAQGGAPEPDPNAPLSTGPGPEPSGSPVPPGVTV